jgi:hypothetical protein
MIVQGISGFVAGYTLARNPYDWPSGVMAGILLLLYPLLWYPRYTRPNILPSPSAVAGQAASFLGNEPKPYPVDAGGGVTTRSKAPLPQQTTNRRAQSPLPSSGRNPPQNFRDSEDGGFVSE